MVAAATLTNVPKTVEYGGYALQADPNNLTVLVFLAGNNLPDPPKALEHAQKAITLPRPATMTEEQYGSIQARMHGVVANSLFAQQKFAEADEHFATALKANPKDHGSQFRFGFGSVAWHLQPIRSIANQS
jgi:tetratricopeptide (TPR) repeat protein